MLPLKASIILCPNSSKFSAAARGFPGRFRTKVSPILPKVVGFPGFIAILSKNVLHPKAPNASFVKSASPTLTPPDVMIRSHSRALLM